MDRDKSIPSCYHRLSLAIVEGVPDDRLRPVHAAEWWYGGSGSSAFGAEQRRSMDRLWAPWRAQYIRDSSGASSADAGCFLCQGLAADRAADRENLVAWRRSHSVVFLNRFPYNNGHLLVAPLVHCGSLRGLSGTDLTGPLETLREVTVVLDRMLRPQGYNLGLNQGKSAGAGLPGHLHWHVVPRWDGDTNFMPVLGHTKVIVESLYEFYDRFVEELASESGDAPRETMAPAHVGARADAAI